MKYPNFLKYFDFNSNRNANNVAEEVVDNQTPECEQLLSSDNNTNDSSQATSSNVVENESNSDANNFHREDLVYLPPKPDIFAPPPYEEIDSGANDVPFLANESNVCPPSYEEVQRMKAVEAGDDPITAGSETASGMQVLRINPLGDIDPLGRENLEEPLLGTDLMFLAAFTGAFLFNIVGIVLLLCLCHTVAGRTGAMAGFGLSMAKWVFIFRNSPQLVKESNAWLLWLMMVLGLLIFMRSIVQYMTAKREWHRMRAGGRNRFFVFY